MLEHAQANSGEFTTMDDELARKVRAAVGMVSEAARMTPAEVTDTSNLFADLGLTSLELVDLALSLELALGIAEFPLQEWIDAQSALGPIGFSVRSLIEACARIVSEGRADTTPTLRLRSVGRHV